MIKKPRHAGLLFKNSMDWRGAESKRGIRRKKARLESSRALKNEA
jgi:hypothetical protein